MKKTVITVKVPKSIYNTVMRIKAWKKHIRISCLAKKTVPFVGTKRILTGGVWEDRNHNIYNCLGQKVGKIEWINRKEGS